MKRETRGVCAAAARSPLWPGMRGMLCTVGAEPFKSTIYTMPPYTFIYVRIRARVIRKKKELQGIWNYKVTL